jgi:hypothetical protein
MASASSAGQRIFKSNVMTAKHVIAKGAHVAVVPPPGAVQSDAFIGFELASRGIQYKIVEKNGASYKDSAGALTAEGLLADGIKLVDSSPVTLNEKPATLVSGTLGKDGDEENQAATGVQLLVLGDDSMAVFIYGYYPASDKSAATMVRNSLLTAIFNPKQSAESGGYKLSANGTSFRFADEVSSTRYYTVDGVPAGGELSSALYTATRIRQGVPEDERASYADKAMESYLSSYEFKVSSRKAVTYAGLKGIEIVADFEGAVRKSRSSSGGVVRRTVPGKGYLVMLFGDASVYSFNGIAVVNSDEYLQQFRRITSTFALEK